MSKYIKLEDAIHNINLEVVGRKEYTGDMKANLFFALDDLPTIEVSEEVLKATKNFNAYTIADENAEMGMRTMIEPILEVSEDDLYIPLNNQTVKRINRLHKDECGEYFDEEWLFNELEQIAEFRETSEDCISREFALEVIDDCINYPTNGDKACAIKNAPSVVPKQSELTEAYIRGYRDGAEQSRVEGEWIKEMHTNIVQIWKCDQCAEMIEQSIQYEYPRWNYCPNCGAKMRSE